MDLWWAERTDAHPGLDALLDAVERGRRDRFVQAADRDRSVVAAALARLVLADRLGTSPTQVAVDRTCATCGRDHGRPRLRGVGPAYSLSHSGDLVVLALASTGEPEPGGVGVDVERVQPGPAPPVARLWRGGTPETGAEPWAAWVRTEAFLKATGAGVSGDLTGLSMVGAGTTHRVLGPRGTLGVVVDLDVRPGYVAALAVLARSGRDVSAPHVTLRDGSALLLSPPPAAVE